MAERVTVARDLTRTGNTVVRVITAAPVITATITVAELAFTIAGEDTLTPVIALAGRIRTGVTAHPDITRTHTTAVIPEVTHTMAVIRTVVTTATRTTRQPTAITHQRLQLYSGGSETSVTITA